MKLKLALVLFCLFCIGMFAHPQDQPKPKARPTIENGPDAIPVIVTSSRKAHPKKPPPPPPPKPRTPAPKKAIPPKPARPNTLPPNPDRAEPTSSIIEMHQFILLILPQWGVEETK